MKDRYIIEAIRVKYNGLNIDGDNTRYYIGTHPDIETGNEKVFMDKLRDYMINNDKFEHSYTLSEATRIMNKHNRYNKLKCNKWYQSTKVFLRRVSKMRKEIK